MEIVVLNHSYMISEENSIIFILSVYNQYINIFEYYVDVDITNFINV